MQKAFKNILAPLLAIMLVTLGNAFFISFSSLRIHDIGFGGWVVGFVQSSYYLGMLIGASRAEGIIKSVGHIRAYLAYAGIGIATVMIQGITPSPYVWIAIRIVMGFCLAVHYIVVESWFLSQASVKTRGVILAIYMITLYLSQSLSQFILNFIDLQSAEPFLVSALLASISAIPLALTKAPAPKLHEVTGYSLKKLFKKSCLGFLGCLISGGILSSIYSFGPLFAKAHKLSAGAVMGICILGGVVLQWPVGKLSDIFDRRRVLFCVTLATAGQSILMLVINPESTWLVYTFIFILGGLVFTMYPLSITHACDRIQPEGLTKATSMLLLAYGVGAVLGPIVTPFFVSLMPTYGLFLFILFSSTILAGVGIYSFLSASAVPEDKQNEFVSLPQITPVAYELDPRIETPEKEEKKK